MTNKKFIAIQNLERLKLVINWETTSIKDRAGNDLISLATTADTYRYQPRSKLDLERIHRGIKAISRHSEASRHRSEAVCEPRKLLRNADANLRNCEANHLSAG